MVSKGSTYLLVIHHLIVGRSYKIWVSYLTFGVIFPKKLTWNLKITTLKRKLIFELPILHFRESSPRRKSSTDAIMAHQSHDSFNWVLPMEQQPRFVHNRTDKQRRRHADVAENDKYYKGGFCLHGNKRRTTIHGYILIMYTPEVRVEHEKRSGISPYIVEGGDFQSSKIGDYHFKF